MIRAVTFDVTGTLISCPRMPEIYAQVLARHGILVPAPRIAEIFPVVWRELDCLTPSGVDRFHAHPEGGRGWWRRLLERLCELCATEPPTAFAAAELYQRFRHAEAWSVYDDVGAALATLRAGDVRLAVVSNWDERLPDLLHNLGLATFFDEIVVSCERGFAKPAREIFAEASNRLGVPAEDCLHVGDSRLHDVEGALAAGLRAVWLDRRGGPHPLSGSPDEGAPVRTLAELPERVHGTDERP